LLFTLNKMAQTQVGSGNIKDGGVKRNDLNVTTAGQSVVRKIIAGLGIKLTSTGQDIGTGDVTVKTSPLNVTFLGVGQRWTGMPNALTEFAGSPYCYRTKIDLTNCTQARIIVRVTTAGAEGAKIRLQYSTNEIAWYYLDGLAGPTVNIDAIGTVVSSYMNMISGAKADVFLRLVGLNGDGETTPWFGNIMAQFK